MKRQIKAVADGHLQVPGQLRKGDELVEFFEVFREMVVKLRRRQEQEIGLLESAIGTLESGTVSSAGKCESCGTALPPVSSGESRSKPLYEVRNEMKAALDV